MPIKLLSTALLFAGLLTSCTSKPQYESLTVGKKMKTQVKPLQLSKTYNIKASADQCKQAWLDVNDLNKWLTVEASTHGKIGEYSLNSVLPYISGRHELESVSNDAITFKWYLGGYATKLKVEFTAKEENCEVKLTHEFPQHTPKTVILGYSPQDAQFIEDNWSICLVRLKAFLEGNKEQVKMPVFHNSKEIYIMLDINISEQKLWESLTNYNLMRKWGEGFYMEGGFIEKKVGGRYSYGWEDEKDEADGPNRITKFVKNKLLAYSWHGGDNSHVTWKIEKLSGKTVRLHLMHSGLDGYESNSWSYKNGWMHSLYDLRDYLEYGIVRKSKG